NKKPMYKEVMAETPSGAVRPDMFLPVLRIGGKCSHFRAKSGKVSGHLPVSPAIIARSPGQNASLLSDFCEPLISSWQNVCFSFIVKDN
ncbi:MAG TPA: hypothetical protein VHZ51_15215, partial [Ktedonobacteraceae bacterium]|nr:hypothetical protein [Ktedonobacteraceae bacterium]